MGRLKEHQLHYEGTLSFSMDFNDIALGHEKKGGAPILNNKFNKFKERIDQRGLLDLGVVGSCFMWRGSIYNGGQWIFERVDRVIWNDRWTLNFPYGYVKVLTKMDFSDHHPLLICLFGAIPLVA